MDDPNINKNFEPRAARAEQSNVNLKQTRQKARGLSSKKAADILKKEGENRLSSQKKVSAAKIFADFNHLVFKRSYGLCPGI